MIAQAIYYATLQGAYKLSVEFSFWGNRNLRQSHHLKTSQLRLSEQFLTRFYFNHVTSDNTTQKPGQYDKSEECLFVKQVSVPEKSHTVLQDETVVFHDTGNCEFFMTSFLTDFSLASSVRLKQSCHSLSFLIASTLGKRRVTPVLNLEIKEDDRPWACLDSAARLLNYFGDNR